VHVHTLRFVDGRGWMEPPPLDLDSPQTLVLAFAAPRFIDEPEPLRQLRAWFPRSQLLGCSTAGEIMGDRVGDDSIVVAVARFERTGLRSVVTSVDGTSDPLARARESFSAGESVARALAGPDLRAVFVLSDGGVRGQRQRAGPWREPGPAGIRHRDRRPGRRR
jgi:hypothetical protein